jgi:hypothetical protein
MAGMSLVSVISEMRSTASATSIRWFSFIFIVSVFGD